MCSIGKFTVGNYELTMSKYDIDRFKKCLEDILTEDSTDLRTVREMLVRLRRVTTHIEHIQV